MAKKTFALTIAGTGIRQDDHGRYSLNDLHKAAGNSRRHEPNLWLRLDQSQALIREIENYTDLCSFDGEETTGIPVVSAVEGRRGGTFVPWEMVYAYAMWISPAFHLKVIRTFHQVSTGKNLRLVTPPNPIDLESLPRISNKQMLTAMKQGAELLRSILQAKTHEEKRHHYRHLLRVNSGAGIDTDSMEVLGIEAPRIGGDAPLLGLLANTDVTPLTAKEIGEAESARGMIRDNRRETKK